MAGENSHALTSKTLNPNIKFTVLEYDRQNASFLIERAEVLTREIQQGIKKPFPNVIKGNIGCCQMMGQTPLTYIRQFLAILSYKPLLDDPNFPDDVKAKARIFLNACRGNSVGAYTDPQGIELVRRQVARFIEERDGIPADWQNVILSAGATGAIRNIITVFRHQENGRKPAVLVPYPQYPVYAALLNEFDVKKIGYYLDEENNWCLKITELQQAVDEVKKECVTKAIVVINPGNPTGQVLSRRNIQEIIEFAHENDLYILADEVYQNNIYAGGSKFHSFKKVATEMNDPYNKVKLASFMSASKGYLGECGLRSGYVEVMNMTPEDKSKFLDAVNINLCPNVFGQGVLYCLVDEPKKGETSYDRYTKEKSDLLESLKSRANMIWETLNTLEGVHCNPIQGAMYAFPQIKLPPKAIDVAKKLSFHPDEFYCLQLLNEAGILTIPGSGFGQKTGTYHFRTTILPQPEVVKDMLERFRVFHREFLKKYQ